MILHLNDGRNRSLGVSGPTMGYAINGFTLGEEDMRELLSWDGDKLHNWLGIMYTRFPPTTPMFATYEAKLGVEND